MRKIRVLLSALILILGVIVCTQSYAAEVTRNLGAQMERPFTPAIYKFRAGANGRDKVYTVVKIYDNQDKDTSGKILYSKALYCLRGGLGFGADDASDVSKEPIKYTEIGEMHKDASSIIEKYKEYYNVDLNRTEKINSKDVNIYNAILWILDEAYLPVNSTNYNEAEYKSELLTKIGIPKVSQADITKDDLEVIQQLAIWYFANYDEQTSGDLQSVSKGYKFPAQFLSINGNNNIEFRRAENLNKIYQYFVYSAIENSKIYEGTTSRTKYIGKNEFDKNLKLEIKSVDYEETIPDVYHPEMYYYEIGPFSIKTNTGDRVGEKLDLSSIILYDANGNSVKRFYEIPVIDSQTGEIKSGGRMKVYTIVNEQGKEVTELEKGIEYYIRFKKSFEKGFKLGDNESSILEEERYDVSKVTLRTTSSYTLATAKFLIKEKADQPVVEIIKEKLSEYDEITTELPKEFDLALRKYIVAVNGKELEVSRAPQIDTSKLNTVDSRTGQKITTAIYNHRKEPVEVKVGDLVKYRLATYNEGEINGYVYTIKDYVPEYLEFVATNEFITQEELENYKKIDTLNMTAEEKQNLKIKVEAAKYVYTFNKDSRILSIEKKQVEVLDGPLNYLWGLEPFTGGTSLDSKYLDVTFKVSENCVSEKDMYLTNVATMTYGAKAGTTSEEPIIDRDSNKTGEEFTVPTEGQLLSENKTQYKGNSTNKDLLDDSKYHYEGQQDDDDFEKLVIKGKEFDLSLRKFINKVERLNKETNKLEELSISSRVPQIEIKDLKEGKATTARYEHPKSVLSLKRGDIIYYTIRVYNEGEIDGYVKEVKDYLPEGLELVEGKNQDWSVSGKTLSTTVLKGVKLPAYDKNLTKEPTSTNDNLQLKWQKASDDETGLYYYDLTVVCKIKSDVLDGQILVNIAEISNDEVQPTDIDDRDSVPNNFPDSDKNNNYEGNGEQDGYYPGKQDDDDFERVIVEPKEIFDLALRKYIVAVNDTNLSEELSRVPDIDITPLKQAETTASYKHKKDPVQVEIGDIVTYRFTVYNEGEVNGFVHSIGDCLPEGLTFDKVSNINFIEYKEQYSEDELKGKEYIYKIEENKLIILPISGTTLFELNAFDGQTLDKESIDVRFKVTTKISDKDQVLTNVATMSYSSKGETILDRDSKKEEFAIPTAEKLLENLPGYKGNEENKNDLSDSEYHYKGQQDDDDFEKIIIKGKSFDLSLRKFITSIKRNGENVEFESRVPKIDTTTLINGTYNRNGNKEYTATYNHSKEPLLVKKGDVVTYTLRIYNEGERDGYATEITDYIPEGLALIMGHNTNYDNGWKLDQGIDAEKQIIKLVGENGFYKAEENVKNLKIDDFKDITSLKDVQLATGKIKITSTMLKDELIKAFDKNKTAEETGWQKATTGEGGLYYKDIEIACLVVAENTCKDVLTNVAEISEDKNENKEDVEDRDSIPDNVISKDEDDNDYEPVILKYFDLALRKFITGVEANGKTEDITSRIPIPKKGEDGKIVYEHTKVPVNVAENNTVIYTIRVYNEGTIAGYAEELTDDIPEGLEFLPEHATNKQYKWIMIDKDGKVTENVKEAEKIITDYLSKSNGAEENLIDAFDSSKPISTQEPLNPDYKDVKVAFKVIEPNTSDRIIVNSAQISEDSGDDEDSIPDEWNEGEDDQDKEYIYVKYFDLSLLKWVTKTIVTVDGKTTITETGFKPNTGKTETTGIRDNSAAEPIAKVVIDRKKLNKTTVKFAYKIRVTNEGEIAGYATELTDFIPEGLEFLAEDNKAYGWVKEGEDKVTTRILETVLLNPGQSAEVEIIFNWKRDKNNLGLKTNIAEITEDYNDSDSKDIDSVPDNKQDPYEKEQEDDDDFALVILSIKTGKGVSYIVFITAMLSLLASGIYLVKKYVLTY